jgi:hypothetical protein
LKKVDLVDPKKSGGGGWPTPDSGGKSRKDEKKINSTIWRC